MDDTIYRYIFFYQKHIYKKSQQIIIKLSKIILDLKIYMYYFSQNITISFRFIYFFSYLYI